MSQLQNPPLQNEPPLLKAAVSTDKVVDVIYNSIAISLSRYFDETNLGQPQGRRIMLLVKEGIENIVGDITLPELPGRPDPPIPSIPPLRQIYALAILLLITPAQAASMMGYSLEELQ